MNWPVTAPDAVIRAIVLRPATQRLPSGPTTIEPAPGREGNSVMTPAVVSRAILLTLDSANQRLRSGPTKILEGPLRAVGIGNSVIIPAVVIRPIWLAPDSMNQRLPSGPAAIL